MGEFALCLTLSWDVVSCPQTGNEAISSPDSQTFGLRVGFILPSFLGLQLADSRSGDFSASIIMWAIRAHTHTHTHTRPIGSVSPENPDEYTEVCDSLACRLQLKTWIWIISSKGGLAGARKTAPSTAPKEVHFRIRKQSEGNSRTRSLWCHSTGENRKEWHFKSDLDFSHC